MAHANARLTFHGRCLLVRRVRMQGTAVAHVAAELGVSRQCAHRWVRRFDGAGWAACVSGLRGRTGSLAAPRPPWRSGWWRRSP
jgi:transposase